MPADIDTPMAKAFLKAYEAKYHSLPSLHPLVRVAGTLTNVPIAAIKARLGPDLAIAGYLHNDLKNLDCFTGQISFDEKGDRVGDLYRLLRSERCGEFILQPTRHPPKARASGLFFPLHGHCYLPEAPPSPLS